MDGRSSPYSSTAEPEPQLTRSVAAALSTTENNAAAPRSGGALSCLLSSYTLDEDREPLRTVTAGKDKAAKDKESSSPEKKSAGLLSPSGRSISDIFGKVGDKSC